MPLRVVSIVVPNLMIYGQPRTGKLIPYIGIDGDPITFFSGINRKTPDCGRHLRQCGPRRPEETQYYVYEHYAPC